MNIQKLLLPEVQSFIKENQEKNVHDLAFSTPTFDGVSVQEVLHQILGLQIAKNKLPTFYNTRNIVFPPKLNLEQTSSEITAEFKSRVFSGKNLCDVTGGFGVDSYYFSKTFEEVTHIEQNSDLQQLAQHNFGTLKAKNINSINANSTDFLKNSSQLFDVIYADPGRRNATQKKVFLLEDLMPNVLNEKDLWFSKARIIFIKLSPLLDLKKVIQQLPEISKIFLVAVKNEMKELLVILEPIEIDKNIEVNCVNLLTNQADFQFYLSGNETFEIDYSEIKKYLYLPNVAVMKSGGFIEIAKTFSLQKLHPNSHIFTSDVVKEDFPGEIFETVEEIKNPKKTLKNASVRIINRNFPMKTQIICSKYRCTSDGVEPILFSRTLTKNVILRLNLI